MKTKQWLQKNWQAIGISLLALMAKINTITTFFKNFNSISMSLQTIQDIGQIIFPFAVIYFVWKLYSLDRVIKKQAEDDSTIAKELIKSQEDLFMMMTLMRVKYDKPDSYKMDLSTMKKLDGIESDIPKLFIELSKEKIWGIKFTKPQILEKMSRFFNRKIEDSNDKK